MTSATSGLALRRPGMSAAFVFAAILFSYVQLRAADHGRYTALFRSQRMVSGGDLRGMDTGENNGTLNGIQLFDPSDAVRVIRDTSKSVTASGPFVEMANGDVLPGRLTEYVAAGIDDGLPAHFVLELAHDSQTIRTQSSHVRVRANAIKRIAAGWQNTHGAKYGSILLKNGLRSISDSIYWSNKGIKALTKDGVLTAGFGQLQDVVLPQTNPFAGVLSDAKWKFIYPNDYLLRVHTSNGSQLTFPQRMVSRDVERVTRQRRYQSNQVEQIAVQPTWALDAIPVPRDSIVFRSYREYSELPLSLLPIVESNCSPGLHHWPWQRNRGVKGSTLRSGDVAVDLGIGMHSYCELTFLLPATAVQFSSHVGMDYSVGQGGCVQCRLQAGGENGNLIWTSGFLRGEDGIKSTGPLEIDGAKQLTLVADFGHVGRPPRADPYDLRDHVAWLMPTVQLDDSKLLSHEDLHIWQPKLDGWSLSNETFDLLKLVPVWNRDAGLWECSMGLEGKGTNSIRLSRQMQVSTKNAWLPIAVRRDGGSRARGCVVRVEVNGNPHGSTMNGDIKTAHASKNADTRVWMLGEFLGQEITLDVVVETLSNWSTGVIWETVVPRPIITGLGKRETPLTPDVLLVSLRPVKHNHKGDLDLKDGNLSDGNPLVVRSVEFQRGFGVPVGTKLTYELNPDWKRFVAVIGLADGWKGAGPYQILLDGKAHWTSELPSYGRNNPGAQIDVAIPPGHKTITLVVLGRDSYGAWANSGFMLR